MANVKIRYLVAKQKKKHTLYYWQPKKEWHEYGFLPMRLAEKTNKLEDAIVEAEKYNAELDAWRATGIEPNAVKEGSLQWLTEKYQQSSWYKKLAPKTQNGYDHWIRRINSTLGKYAVLSITRAVCKAYYNKLEADSLSNANAALRVLKLLFTFAIDEGIINDNPAKGIRITGTEPRHQVWSYDEIKEFIKKAIEENRRSVALAVKLAEGLGQRQGDVLKMTWDKYDGKSIKIKQGKTGRSLDVPCSLELRKWLNSTPKVSTHIIVSEVTHKPYKEYNFRHVFGDLIAKTEIKDRWFLDLRRTAAVRLAEAGCSALEITAITGHKIDSGAKILETYTPRNSDMAKNAMDKLQDYRNK